MEGIKEKAIQMKDAAKILAVPYGTLYAKYKERFGFLRKEVRH